MRALVDWKNSLNLPKTEFPMRADLARREPVWLKRWAEEKLYERVLAERESAKAEPYVLHDGPPYPTGGIHYGTLLNKVLKDIIVRSRLLMGKSARFVPGWDCHGLPIEQQVEKKFGAKAKQDTRDFRQKCEAHAHKFVDVMRADFRRLGCFGTWDEPYLTLNKDYEATIVRVMAAFAAKDLLYRAKRPVHWCTTHQTALAEAEVEYADHASPSIFVRFPVVAGQPALEAILGKAPAALVIWTTTPWTLAANLAIVANPALAYVAVPVERPGQPREYLIVARELADGFLTACELTAGPKETWIDVAGDKLRALRGLRYQHPFIATPKSDKDFRLTFASHATLDAGTGLVHTAPGHGADDYAVGRSEGLDVYAPVDSYGRYTAEVPNWAGMQVFEANPKIVALLAETGYLLNKPGEQIKHSYPHCWRCKHPVIFRATSQWFARLGDLGDKTSLREQALAEIDRTQWIPAWGRDRIRGMIEVRPDWCLSRQRVWGVPIPAFLCKKCDEPFLDAAAMEHVAKIFASEGSSAWFGHDLPALPWHRFREDPRHRRCVVRIRRIVGCGRRRQTRAQGGQSRSLFGGRRPTPWLVPFVLAGRSCRAWIRALQGGAHPRLGARRAWQGLFQVRNRKGTLRWHQDRLRRAHRVDGKERRRALAPVGRVGRLPIGHRVLQDHPRSTG
jgi:isoleucyl-tRNA synthetase